MTGDTAVRGQPGAYWTVALRRQPVRIVRGEPEGGYTDAYELICCDCGDNPDLDYLDVAPELQQVRGPYPLPAGVSAYVLHVQRYHAGRPAVPLSLWSPALGEARGPPAAVELQAAGRRRRPERERETVRKAPAGRRTG